METILAILSIISLIGCFIMSCKASRSYTKGYRDGLNEAHDMYMDTIDRISEEYKKVNNAYKASQEFTDKINKK